MFEVTSIATVGQLNRMLFGIVMMSEQFNRMIQVASVAARKELSLLFALRVPVFGMFSLSLHYYTQISS